MHIVYIVLIVIVLLLALKFRNTPSKLSTVLPPPLPIIEEDVNSFIGRTEFEMALNRVTTKSDIKAMSSKNRVSKANVNNYHYDTPVQPYSGSTRHWSIDNSSSTGCNSSSDSGSSSSCSDSSSGD